MGELTLAEAADATPARARWIAICNACEHPAHSHTSTRSDVPFVCEECGCSDPTEATWLSERTYRLWTPEEQR